MMLDPLRVKKSLRTGSKFFEFFRPRSLFFDFGWLKHLDRLLNYQFRFSNFPNLPILNQMKLFSLEFGSKQRSTLFEKTFMVSTPGTCSFIQVLELFSFSFLPHRGEMTRPFFVRKCGNLSRTSSHCHPEITKVDRPPSGDDVPNYIFRPVPFNHLMISSLDYGFFIFNRSLKIKLDLEIRIIDIGGSQIE